MMIIEQLESKLSEVTEQRDEYKTTLETLTNSWEKAMQGSKDFSILQTKLKNQAKQFDKLIQENYNMKTIVKNV